MNSINPFTGEIVNSTTELSSEALQEKLVLSAEAFQIFRFTTIDFRVTKMHQLAHLLREQKETLAQLITAEMGKIITESRAEIEKCALVCTYYAENAPTFLQDELLSSHYSKSYISYEPLGCILAVMPWNFPFWQVFRFAAPTIMAGNVAVLKHASNVSLCALAIEKLFVEAGFSAGVFQTLIIKSNQVNQVIAHEAVKAVSLTGSEQAGSQVAAQAGLHIKKTLLELGGSDPFLVLEDVDVSTVVDMAVKSRFLNCGQSCIAAKRFIVPKRLKNKFLALFMEKVESLKVGDPMHEGTQIGPMARLDLLEKLDKQVDDSVALGAVLITGGAAFDPDKCLYTPTILADVRKGMPAYDEELFGPVAAVITYDTIDEAIFLANDTPYGLGASIWTTNTKRAEEIARKIDAGAVFINEIVKSDPALPFGGMKLSGYGRELSLLGIREFTNQKTIVVH